MFTWFENSRKTEDGFDYTMWFLVDDTGRIVATIDGPTSRTFCFIVNTEKQEGAYVRPP